MIPAILTKEVGDFLICSGWQQFWLDDKFNLSSSVTQLANFCNVAPHTLTNQPLLNLFTPADREKLKPILTNLSTDGSLIPPTVFTLQTTSSTKTVEVILCRTKNKDSSGNYTGFIRAVPHAPQKNKLQATAQLCRKIANATHLDTLLTDVADHLHQDFGYEYVSIFLVDAQTTTLTLKSVSGKNTSALSGKAVNIPLNNSTLIGQVAQRAEPLLIEHQALKTSPTENHLPVKPQCELIVPLVAGSQVLGILDIQSSYANAYNNNDLAILTTIASQIATVIKNTRLLSQLQCQVEQVEGLLEASRALNTINLQSILDTIVQRVSILLKADHTVVYLADNKTKRLNATAVHHSSDIPHIPTPAFDFGEGTVGWVLEHQQPLKINDLSQDDRFTHKSNEAHLIANLVSTPLTVQGETIGVLEATHKAGGQDFTDEELSLLLAFASQAAVAIYNARLYRERQRQIRALTILTQASENITRAANLDQLLKIVLDFTLSIVNAEYGAILLRNSDNKTLRMETAQGIDPDMIAVFNRLNISEAIGVIDEAQKTREIVEIKNSRTDSRVLTFTEIPFELPKSFIVIPLFSREDFIGVIILPTLPNEDSKALLKAITGVAAVAIDKAQLFKETNQRLAEMSTLYTLADQLTRVLEFERVIESSVTIIKHAMDCTCCSLFLKDPLTTPPVLKLKTSIGWPENEQAAPELDYITALAATLINNPNPAYIADITAENNGTGQGSVMAMPLLVKDELLGVLVINDQHPHAFGSAEGRLLSIATAQISTAIENGRLYDNLEQRAIELETALEEVEEANRLKSEFVENVSHELRTPLTFIKAYVSLILDEELGQIPQTVREKLMIVSQKTGAIIRLVEDLVSLQKIEASTLKPESVDTHDFITRIVQWAIASAAEHNIEIVVNSSPNLPKIYVDPDRMGQVFDNLVGNALKFSPNGGKIFISAQPEGEQMKLSVRDNGIGIHPDKLAEIFQRFYQIDRNVSISYQGAGLGLTIVKQIIEAHQGHITVESTPGQGTTFSFWVAIDTSESAAKKATEDSNGNTVL